MKVLSIYGSPHRDGFSSKIHDFLCESILPENHEVIFSYDRQVKPCIACAFCKDNNYCTYDDMTDIYDSIRNATHIIISSPLYFSSLAAVVKNIIDRCQVLWEEAQRDNNSIITKKGMFICTGGSNYKDMFLGAEIPVRHFFTTLGAQYNKDDFIYLLGCDDLDFLPEDIITKTSEVSNRFF